MRNTRPTVLAAVIAAAVLYNMAIAARDVIPDRIPNEEFQYADGPEDPIRGNDYEIDQGQEMRAALVNAVFK